jgi:Protein of unknown function (DUF4239)
MSFYWVYDMSNTKFFFLVITFFILFSLLGAFIFSRWFENKLNLTKETNNIVAIFLSLSGVVYGVTLGLIAVATFENYSGVEAKVDGEASALAGLYRDVNMLEKDGKIELKNTLKKYTKYVIEEAWPLQRKGIVPKGGTQIVNIFQNGLSLYSPNTDKDRIIYAEVFAQYNKFIEARRSRLNAVSTGLPGSVWLILFVGALINIVLTWLLVIQNKKLDIIVNSLMGLLLGSLIFLIAAMDNPFRGDFSVGPDAFQLIYDGLMK